MPRDSFFAKGRNGSAAAGVKQTAEAAPQPAPAPVRNVFALAARAVIALLWVGGWLLFAWGLIEVRGIVADARAAQEQQATLRGAYEEEVRQQAEVLVMLEREKAMLEQMRKGEKP